MMERTPEHHAAQHDTHSTLSCLTTICTGGHFCNITAARYVAADGYTHCYMFFIVLLSTLNTKINLHYI